MTGVIEVAQAPGSSGTLSESFQTIPLKFTFAIVKENKRVPIHPWIMCRDFFSDVIAAPRVKNTLFCHGFSARSDWKFDPRLTRYLVKAPNKEIAQQLLDHCDLGLDKFNDYFDNVRPTKIELILPEKHIFEVTAPKVWSRMPQLLSYHSQFIRLLANPAPMGGDNYLELWHHWRNHNPPMRSGYTPADVDLERLRSLNRSQLDTFHEFVFNALEVLRKAPKTKTLPHIVDNEDSFDDEEKCDNWACPLCYPNGKPTSPKKGQPKFKPIGIYDYHDNSGWVTCATRIRSAAWEEFHQRFKDWNFA